MKTWHVNKKIAVILFIFSVAYLIIAFQIPSFSIPRPIDSDLFPKVLGMSMLVLSVLLFFEKKVEPVVDMEEEEKTLEEVEEVEEAAESEDNTEETGWKHPKMQVLITIVTLIVYIVLFEFLGFVLSTIGLLYFLTFYYGYTRHLINGIVTVSVSVGFYLIMTKGLNVYLPTGLLPF
ncbi:tripartite tricarboxylate transporter TctB family protein [Halalkalibacter urbisdiaboli]|uniref:tripartite tricarboxylate transporter TctB family protein n=1 Tax=Halalkalibacter urbisdiaboli TaxID=1960589 RepID=UPI0013FDD1CF|nr:tripartite tricarboxylate transporter TctB family protein [Halalkalibacter urbisdiaboli]